METVKHILIAFAMTWMIIGQPASAREIADISIPDAVKPDAAGEELILNGAGIRKKFFFKIYVGALYLRTPSTDAGAILAAGGPWRVYMHILHTEIEREKLVAAWNEGFAGNNSDSRLATLKPRLDTFNGMFTTVKQGDRIVLDYLPTTGTRVQVNDVNKGTIAGEDFQQALLSVWLGEKPADKGLKKGMLGAD